MEALRMEALRMKALRPLGGKREPPESHLLPSPVEVSQGKKEGTIASPGEWEKQQQW
jgi:hypothetical protein